uniref:Uncharacterized protein n=1 Tax=Rhizophora mucronata TaxID=61149 RepID=A0A2P2R449_RHIMU
MMSIGNMFRDWYRISFAMSCLVNEYLATWNVPFK